MIKFLLIQLIFCSLTFQITAQTTCTSTFVKTIGSAISNESGYSLAMDDVQKVIYVGGSINDSTMLVKVNADGEILWSRTFDVIPVHIERVIALILDSDGMLCLAGMTDNSSGGVAFLVKYDPEQDQILWAKIYEQPSLNYAFGLIEKEPGGNYLISTNPLGENDAELLEIDRNTGLINQDFSTHYHLGSAETIWGMVMHETSVYITGRYTDGGSSTKMRTMLSRLDAENGIPSWTKLGHQPNDATARLYGTDLIIDQDEIYLTSTGDPTGTDLTMSQMFIHKASLDGDVLWTKHYPIPAADDVSEEIIATGDGFIIMGRNTGPNDLFLFKINHEGNVLWARKYDFAGNETTFPTGGTFSQLVSMDGALYFTASLEQNGRRDMILVKTDSEGRLDEECTVAQTFEINVTNVENAAFYDVDPLVFTFVPTVKNLEITPAHTSLETENTCLNAGGIESNVEAAICEGDSFEGYELAGTYSDTFNLGNGCDSIRILHLRLVVCDPLVQYDLNACTSYMSDGSNMDYTEFTPVYPASDICATVSATNLYRTPPQENKHSCTPGLNNSSAMCVSSLAGCTWIPGHQASVIMEVTITPEANGISELTGLQFYEKAPNTYNWTDGDSGPNNYPTLFGIRILKDGTEIYANPAIPTTTGWSLHEFNFIGDSLFEIDQATLFRIELLPYCPVGNGADVAAWDLEDIVLTGGCVILPGSLPLLQGKVVTSKGHAVKGAEVHLSKLPAFTIYNADAIGSKGEYQFPDLELGSSYFARGNNNSDFLRGVNTMDLIRIQKHLLGIQPFTTLDQFVAADINRDGVVNSTDLITLRKTILGNTPYFPGNTSWRFGVWPQSLESSDPSSLKETLFIESMQGDTMQADFLGIKIGDLNGSVNGFFRNQQNEIGDNDVIELAIDDVAMRPGIPFTISIRAMEDINTDGLQLGWQFNGISILSVEGVGLAITEDHVSFQQDGSFRLSWNSEQPVHLLKGDILFSITLVSSLDEPLYGNIRQVDDLLDNEFYHEQTTYPIKLDILPSVTVDAPSISFFSVTPNPFTEETTINYGLTQDGYVRINVFDASGILRFTTEKLDIAGDHALQLNGADLGQYSGLIFCQIICEGDVRVRKVLRL